MATRNRRLNNLTDTTAQNIFPLSRSETNHVLFAFNTDPSRPAMTRFTLRKGSTWRPDAHWHESYDEHLLVIQGRVKVILDNQVKIVTASDGPQLVERFVVHEWMRADHDSNIKDEGDVIVEEWTDPADAVKQVFFRNILGVVGDAKPYWRSWTIPQLVLMMDVYDNYPDLMPTMVPRQVSYGVTHALFGVAKAISWVIGLRPWYEAYTPSELQSIAARGCAVSKGIKAS